MFSGTDCGPDMWCMESVCVSRSENQSSLNHGPNTCDLRHLNVQGNCSFYERQCAEGNLKGYLLHIFMNFVQLKKSVTSDMLRSNLNYVLS